MASGFGWGVRLAVHGGGREVVIHAVPDVSASDTDVSDSDTFWWPLKNSDRCVSDFLTGVAFRNKPMSETSILDMLIHRREEAKQKLLRAPTSGNETCEKQAACNSFMSSIVAAGESSEAKREKIVNKELAFFHYRSLSSCWCQWSRAWSPRLRFL